MKDNNLQTILVTLISAHTISQPFSQLHANSDFQLIVGHTHTHTHKHYHVFKTKLYEFIPMHSVSTPRLKYIVDDAYTTAPLLRASVPSSEICEEILDVESPMHAFRYRHQM